MHKNHKSRISSVIKYPKLYGEIDTIGGFFKNPPYMSALVAPFEPRIDVRFRWDESGTDNGEHYNVDINSLWGWVGPTAVKPDRHSRPTLLAATSSEGAHPHPFTATHPANRSRENVSTPDRCSILICSQPEYRIDLMKNAIGIPVCHFHGGGWDNKTSLLVETGYKFWKFFFLSYHIRSM